MALAASKTLAEIREAVGIRMGMGQQVSNSTALHSMLDEHIRTAFNLLVREAHWVVLDSWAEIDLIQDQHYYEFPDNIEVGGTREITVEDINNQEYRLHPGVAHYERNAFRQDRGGTNRAGATSGLPLRWEIEDGKLAIYPAPDTEQYVRLKVRGKALPFEPYNDNDQVVIDAQAIILQATVLGKQHFKLPNPEQDEQVLRRHLMNMRENQSDGESVQIGPERSSRYDGRPRTNRHHIWPWYDPEGAARNHPYSY
jgi:hypothetical protein